MIHTHLFLLHKSDQPHPIQSSLRHTVASVGVFGLGAGDTEKLNESLSHTFHSLASEFTTRTVRGSEQRLHASHAIKNSTVQQGHDVSYVTGVTLKSAVTFQRQLSSLIYLHASPVSPPALTHPDSHLHPIWISPQLCSRNTYIHHIAKNISLAQSEQNWHLVEALDYMERLTA